jgi:hypothetical protein
LIFEKELLKLKMKIQVIKRKFRKMNSKNIGQEITRKNNLEKMSIDECNMLISSDISYPEIMQEKSSVNKMILVLIFLMVR